MYDEGSETSTNKLNKGCSLTNLYNLPSQSTRLFKENLSYSADIRVRYCGRQTDRETQTE